MPTSSQAKAVITPAVAGAQPSTSSTRPPMWRRNAISALTFSSGANPRRASPHARQGFSVPPGCFEQKGDGACAPSTNSSTNPSPIRAELFETFWNFLVLFGTFWNLKLFGTFWYYLVLFGTFETFWYFLELRTFWNFLTLFETFWYFLEHFRTF